VLVRRSREMPAPEIHLPYTRPQSEWVRGRPVQKVIGTYEHAALQAEIVMLLRAWAVAGDHGRVGTEWRFRLGPAGEMVRPLVPDVAYRSYASLPRDASALEVATPSGAPTVLVEVLAKHELRADVDDKVRTYLRSGAEAVLLVDPTAETITVHDRDETRTWAVGEQLVHRALPGLVVDVGALFVRARR